VQVPTLYTWVERDNVGQSFLSKETTQWQGLGVKPATFRSYFHCANYYTTMPPNKIQAEPIFWKWQDNSLGIISVG